MISGPVLAGSGPHTIAPGLFLPSGFGTLNLFGGLTTTNNTTLDFKMNPYNHDQYRRQRTAPSMAAT